MNAFVIDAFEFCRVNESREGEVAVADLPRLAEESVDKSGSVRWSLQGGRDMRGNPQLTLAISGDVQLICQRCLSPFAFGIESESVLVLARDEASADEMEAQLADESIEVIVGSRAFNFVDLIEDEALLAIPLSPKHEFCPSLGVPDVSKDAEKASPFAVLKNLKK